MATRLQISSAASSQRLLWIDLKPRAYDLLSRYNELAPSLPLHAKANMPGKVLLYHGLELITHNPKAWES